MLCPRYAAQCTEQSVLRHVATVVYDYLQVKVKVNNPITCLDRPGGSQEVEAPRFQDSRHMKVVRLSALNTGRLYPSGNIHGTNFC